MDPALLALCSQHRVFLRREAADLGYDDRAVAAAVRHGLWHRIRRGAYTLGHLWHSADAQERHRIHSRAVLRSMQGRVALSHVSSMVERGVATWGADLSKVHVTRLDKGAGRIEKDVIHHEGLAVEGDVEEHNGLLVVRAARGLVEASGLHGVQQGLVMADSALHRGIVDEDDFARTYRQMERWPHTRSVQLVLRLSDGRAESPGETRARYLCWTQGLPLPDLQFRVYDEHGILVGITDFAWHELRLLGEFDGRIKYGRLLKPGQDPGDAVFAEKEREDMLRELTGYGMVRFLWSQFKEPMAMAARVRRLGRRAA